MTAQRAAAVDKDPVAQFEAENKQMIKTYKQEAEWQALSSEWMHYTVKKRYCYNFAFLGRPIIQMPQDIYAFQEIVWAVKPDLIIETGIAHGGSLVMSAGMLALLDYCEAVEQGVTLDPKATKRRVLGIDIDIRAHNRAAIEAHPMGHRIDMIQGSSIAPEIVNQVKEIAKNYKRILISLDSNHTHDHVLAELEAYAPLTSKGSYCVVCDTIVADLPDGLYPDRPWHKNNSPKGAVHEYLERLKNEDIKATDGEKLDLIIDKEVEDKLVLTVTPDGYLKRV